MKGFEYFYHTADTMFRGYGKTLEERFSNAAYAMVNVMVDIDKVRQNRSVNFDVEGNDMKALLYNFLEEFLFMIDAEGFLLSRIEVIKIEGNRLICEASGDDMSNGYDLHGDVKAVTYNMMEITDEYVQVVVDI